MRAFSSPSRSTAVAPNPGAAAASLALFSGWRLWALLALFSTLIGLLSFSVQWTSDLAEGGKEPAKIPLLMELTGAYCFLLLLPPILWFIRRFPITAGNWWHRLPLHLAATAVVGPIHTLLMWGSRVAAFALLGWGTYDYGDMRYRFPMEYLKQFVSYWIVFAVVTVVAMSRRSRERELRASELERQLSEARLNALKMQLNPHFLFNTLNTISSFVRDDPEAAEAMIANLSDLLRLALRHGNLQEVTLATELDFLAPYLDIMRARFSDRLTIHLEVPAEVGEALVPHLVLQPLAENAIVHSTSDPAKAATVRIAATSENDRLRLTVEDNGPGLAVDEATALRRGVGLSTTAERLARLYSGAASISLTNRAEGGCQVTLDLPMRSEAEVGRDAP